MQSIILPPLEHNNNIGGMTSAYGVAKDAGLKRVSPQKPADKLLSAFGHGPNDEEDGTLSLLDKRSTV